MEAFAAYAAHEFELAAPQSDGSTLKEHLVAAWERSGRQPAKLAEAPPLPAPELWRDFLELHHCRAVTQAGPAAISWLDIDAWQRVRGASLEAWEIDCIRVADAAYLRQFAKGTKS